MRHDATAFRQSELGGRWQDIGMRNEPRLRLNAGGLKPLTCNLSSRKRDKRGNDARIGRPCPAMAGLRRSALPLSLQFATICIYDGLLCDKLFADALVLSADAKGIEAEMPKTSIGKKDHRAPLDGRFARTVEAHRQSIRSCGNGGCLGSA
jgi:hypothetical protein